MDGGNEGEGLNEQAQGGQVVGAEALCGQAVLTPHACGN